MGEHRKKYMTYLASISSKTKLSEEVSYKKDKEVRKRVWISKRKFHEMEKKIAALEEGQLGQLKKLNLFVAEDNQLLKEVKMLRNDLKAIKDQCKSV